MLTSPLTLCWYYIMTVGINVVGGSSVTGVEICNGAVEHNDTTFLDLSMATKVSMMSDRANNIMPGL